MKYDILYNFISPVTGRVLADPNYVLVGDNAGIATPSPILIDLRLDLINLRRDYDILADASFVVGSANPQLPNAQVLDILANGFMYNTAGVVSTTSVIPIESLPDLTDGYLWIGDATNRPVEQETISSSNLPTLLFGNLWIGDITGRPFQQATISVSNLPDLTLNNIWVGDVTNRPVEQTTISVGNLPNLTLNKVWVGDVTNRPVEQDFVISPYDATYVLNQTDVRLPNAQVLDDIGTGMAKITTGGYVDIAIPYIDYATVDVLVELAAEAAASAGAASSSAGAAFASAGAAATSAGAAAISADQADDARDDAEAALAALLATGLNALPNHGDVNIQGYRVINMAQSPNEDFDAVTAKFVWDLLHDEVDILWS
jgi:hypothetical protein